MPSFSRRSLMNHIDFSFPDKGEPSHYDANLKHSFLYQLKKQLFSLTLHPERRATGNNELTA